MPGQDDTILEQEIYAYMQGINKEFVRKQITPSPVIYSTLKLNIGIFIGYLRGC